MKTENGHTKEINSSAAQKESISPKNRSWEMRSFVKSSTKNIRNFSLKMPKPTAFTSSQLPRWDI